MSDCKYCGKSAGFLKSEHADCRKKYDAGLKVMSQLALEAAYSGNNLLSLDKELTQVAEESFIPKSKVKEIIIHGYSAAIDKALDDGILENKEEEAIVAYKENFSLTQDELDNDNKSYVKYVKAKMIREVLNGEVPSINLNVGGDFPIILQKNEKLLWIFQGVSLLETRVKTQYKGTSHGLSIRVAKGLYYRPSMFQGSPIKTEVTAKIDTGLLVVTDKTLYFSGSRKKSRIRLSEIMELERYSDGIGVTKNSATSKPQAFIVDDAWFAYNLISNLVRL
jgi:hypothetical protein